MSEPRVTITLGRSGQKVVKQAGPVSDGARTDSRSLSGSKRPVRDRLGSNVDSSNSLSKRHRGGDVKNRLDDTRGSRADLRLKLMARRIAKQSMSEHEEHRRMEQRERPVRADHPPRQANVVHHIPGRSDDMFYRQVPRTENAESMRLRHPQRESNSSWTSNGLRHRSPERFLSSSRDLSPLNRVAGLRPGPPVSAIDASRNGRYLSSDFVNPSRPTGLPPVTMKNSSEYAKPIAQPAPTSGPMQKSAHMVEEPLTVAGLLNSLGLGKYAILFQAEEVDMTALKQMGDNDLKELGIPMGPRKKILVALLPRSKRQPP